MWQWEGEGKNKIACAGNKEKEKQRIWRRNQNISEPVKTQIASFSQRERSQTKIQVQTNHTRLIDGKNIEPKSGRIMQGKYKRKWKAEDFWGKASCCKSFKNQLQKMSLQMFWMLEHCRLTAVLTSCQRCSILDLQDQKTKFLKTWSD